MTKARWRRKARLAQELEGAGGRGYDATELRPLMALVADAVDGGGERWVGRAMMTIGRVMCGRRGRGAVDGGRGATRWQDGDARR